MPAVVALVATNFAAAERPRAYGLVASAGAIAVAVGPLVGGLCTTYLTWRVVFFGEVVVVLCILGLSRRMADSPRESGVHLDLVGTALSAAGLGLFVYGVIRSGSWGIVQPKSGAPTWLGMSPVIWLLLGGAGLARVVSGVGGTAGSAGIRRRSSTYAYSRRPGLQAGLTSFFFQFLLQAGLFFVIPLFLSVALGLSAVATGVRLLPLSVTLLAAAVGVPKLFPQASPRRVVRVGFGLLLLGIVVLLAALDAGAGPEVVTWPLLLIGLGIGSLASQLGARHGLLRARLTERRRGRDPEHGDEPRRVNRHSADGGRPDRRAHDDVPGLRRGQPRRSRGLSERANVELSSGIPFVSDADLTAALDKAEVPPQRRRPSSTKMPRAGSTGSEPPLLSWRSSRCCRPRVDAAPSRRPNPPATRRSPHDRSSEDRSAPPKGDAAPGPLAARRAGHAMVEPPTRPPDSDGELEDQQVQDADMRGLAASLARDGEGATLGQTGCPRRKARLSGSIGAPENSARFPAGNAIVPPVPLTCPGHR